jgi:uncharacterized protein YndB with AHSA1/START domain
MNTDYIEKKVLLHAPRKRIWRALSDSTEFGTWFGVKFDGPFSPGASMHGVIAPTTVNTEVGNAQKKYKDKPFEITIEEMEPEQRFSFRWHPYAIEPGVDYSAEPTTLVVFLLEEAENGVMLIVRESGFDRIPLERRAKSFAANESGWTMQVKSFAQYIDHAQ